MTYGLRGAMCVRCMTVYDRHTSEIQHIQQQKSYSRVIQHSGRKRNGRRREPIRLANGLNYKLLLCCKLPPSDALRARVGKRRRHPHKAARRRLQRCQQQSRLRHVGRHVGRHAARRAARSAATSAARSAATPAATPAGAAAAVRRCCAVQLQCARSHALSTPRRCKCARGHQARV